VPEFSVVIPTYGRPDFLREAVASVIAQTVTDFECILVDDASPEPAVPPDDPRFRLVRREHNGGPPAARNTGIDAATGTYLAFLDDDDVWVPERLALAREAHRRAPVTICWQTTLGAPAEPTGRILDGDVSATILEGMIPHLGTTTVERTIAPRFDERYEASDDVEWWLRVAQQHAVATTPKVGLQYRVHATPRARTGQLNRIVDARRLFDEHADYFRRHPKAKAFRLKRMGLSALRVHDRKLALQCFAGSMRLHPEPRTAWHALRALAPGRERANG
jgi:glycosyltransferase involved in cell wall biosynthesis